MKAIINKIYNFDALAVEDGVYISNVAIKETPRPSVRIRFLYNKENENILRNFADNLTPIFKIEITNNIGDIIFTVEKDMFCTNVFHFINPQDNYLSATFVEENNE